MFKPTLVTALTFAGSDAISIGLETSTNESKTTDFLIGDLSGQILAQTRHWWINHDDKLQEDGYYRYFTMEEIKGG